jgi:hypothetical protein
MKVIIETERLIVREYVEDDAEAFFRLNSNPEVLLFVPDAGLANVEEARKILMEHPIADYRKHGFGRGRLYSQKHRRKYRLRGSQTSGRARRGRRGLPFHASVLGTRACQLGGVLLVPHGYYCDCPESERPSRTQQTCTTVSRQPLKSRCLA